MTVIMIIARAEGTGVTILQVSTVDIFFDHGLHWKIRKKLNALELHRQTRIGKTK